MPAPNPKYVSELNELAQLCTDSAESYRRAVERLESPRIAAFCKRRAEEREKLAGQFRIRIEQLGESATEGGTLRGTAEKALGEAKSLVGDDQEAILSELLRIEEHLKERFEVFHNAKPAPEVESLISEHYDSIAEDYQQLRDLTRASPDD